jgi:hypothetical protein
MLAAAGMVVTEMSTPTTRLGRRQREHAGHAGEQGNEQGVPVGLGYENGSADVRPPPPCRGPGRPLEAGPPARKRQDGHREADRQRGQRPSREIRRPSSRGYADPGDRPELGTHDHRPEDEDGRVEQTATAARRVASTMKGEEAGRELRALRGPLLELLPDHRVRRVAAGRAPLARRRPRSRCRPSRPREPWSATPSSRRSSTTRLACSRATSHSIRSPRGSRAAPWRCMTFTTVSCSSRSRSGERGRNDDPEVDHGSPGRPWQAAACSEGAGGATIRRWITLRRPSRAGVLGGRVAQRPRTWPPSLLASFPSAARHTLANVRSPAATGPALRVLRALGRAVELATLGEYGVWAAHSSGAEAPSPGGFAASDPRPRAPASSAADGSDPGRPPTPAGRDGLVQGDDPTLRHLPPATLAGRDGLARLRDEQRSRSAAGSGRSCAARGRARDRRRGRAARSRRGEPAPPPQPCRSHGGG